MNYSTVWIILLFKQSLFKSRAHFSLSPNASRLELSAFASNRQQQQWQQTVAFITHFKRDYTTLARYEHFNWELRKNSDTLNKALRVLELFWSKYSIHSACHFMNDWNKRILWLSWRELKRSEAPAKAEIFLPAKPRLRNQRNLDRTSFTFERVASSRSLRTPPWAINPLNLETWVISLVQKSASVRNNWSALSYVFFAVRLKI